MTAPAAVSAAGAAGGSAAVMVRGPGGAVKPAPLYTVSDSAERRLQRLLEKLRSEGFALGMRLTAWFQVGMYLVKQFVKMFLCMASQQHSISTGPAASVLTIYVASAQVA